MPDEIVPEGWTATTLGAIGKYLNGRAFKTTEWSKTGRPIIRIQDLTRSNLNPNHFEGEVEDRYVIRPGDFLISWSATLGAYIWEGPEAVLNQHIFKVESRINQRFHYHLVRQRIAELERSAHGSGMVHVTKRIFEDTHVAIPEDETIQQQIADLIDVAELSQTSACDHLAAASEAIRRFRKAVLSAACSGRLSADWRDTHLGMESVARSLDELQARRRAEQKRRYRDPELNRYSAPEGLPTSWALSPLGLMLRGIKYGTSRRSEYGQDGTPVLRIPNVSGKVFDINDLKFAHLERREVVDLALKSGDLLMIRSNGSVELVGKARLVPRTAFGMAYAGYLMRLRPDSEAIEPRYLELVLASPPLRVQIEMPARSTSGVHNINTEEVRALGIPLPQMKEQQEIVRRVDGLFGLADSLFVSIKTANQLIDRSSQAVLAKAFRGQLVPTSDQTGFYE